MTDDCEDRLLEIQYFMAREWSLDPKLVEACNNEVQAVCVALRRKRCFHMEFCRLR